MLGSNTIISQDFSSYWAYTNQAYTPTTFGIYATDINNIGYYKVLVTATLTNNAGTLITSSSESFNLQIYCYETAASFTYPLVSTANQEVYAINSLYTTASRVAVTTATCSNYNTLDFDLTVAVPEPISSAPWSLSSVGSRGTKYLQF